MLSDRADHLGRIDSLGRIWPSNTKRTILLSVFVYFSDQTTAIKRLVALNRKTFDKVRYCKSYTIMTVTTVRSHFQLAAPQNWNVLGGYQGVAVQFHFIHFCFRPTSHSATLVFFPGSTQRFSIRLSSLVLCFSSPLIPRSAHHCFTMAVTFSVALHYQTLISLPV